MNSSENYKGYEIAIFEGHGSFTDDNIVALPYEVHIRTPKGGFIEMKAQTFDKARKSAHAIIDRELRPRFFS